jgi:F0F1-type ATP synthase assembly protein I
VNVIVMLFSVDFVAVSFVAAGVGWFINRKR